MPSSIEGGRLLSALRAGAVAPLPDALATGFRARSGALTPIFAGTGEAPSARVSFPPRSTGRVHIEDAATGASVDVALAGARDVAAEPTNGYVLYEQAHASGAHLLHRALPDGTEDYLSFARRPAAAEVAYHLTLGPLVAGLRLVAGALELLDASGTPRLRVAAPFVVGADGVRTDASLAVEGCAVDTSPAGPWGRAVTAPGATSCTVHVGWDDAEVQYPALLDPKWTTTGSMTTARQDHTATFLPATGKVLVVGGRTSGASTTGLVTADLFDPATNTWSPTGSLAGTTPGRWSHTAIQLNTGSNTLTSGKVLVAGGINGSASLTTAQLYTVTGTGAGTWTAVGTSMAVARHLHTATLLGNGNVLVAGGMTNTSVVGSATIYNPGGTSTGSWTPVSTNMSARRFHTATFLTSSNSAFNNKVLMLGGNSGGTTTVTTFQLFDQATSTWSSATTLATGIPREGHTATKLANGNVLLAGGKSGTAAPLNSSFVFTIPSSGSTATFPGAGTLNARRWGHSATLLQSGILPSGQSVVIAGGSADGTTSIPSAELWNGASTWTPTTDLPAPLRAHTATLLAGGKVLVAGGINSSTVATGQVFDPSLGASCTSNGQCATGFCVGGVCCDSACNGGCGSCTLAGKVGTCSAVTSGTTCRAAAGVCDTAEICNGTTLACPADGFKAAGTACADDGNACTGDSCDGTTATCRHGAVADGSPCNDGNACTLGETCQQGLCKPGPGTTCGTGNSVTFYQSFENGATVDIAGGSKTPVRAPVPFVEAPGVFGKGVDGSTTYDVNYVDPSGTSINFARPGSVSYWFKNDSSVGAEPVGFVAIDGYAHIKFVISAGPAYLFAYFEFSDPNNGGAWTPAAAVGTPGMADLTVGEWHLLVVNWSFDAIGISIDGGAPAVTPVGWLAGNHVFGPDVGNLMAVSGSMTSPGAFYPGAGDEVIIMNRPMTLAEIRWYWAQRSSGGPGVVNPAIAHFNANTTACNQWDDLNPCTTDACTSPAGPTHAPVAAGTTCGDGNACKLADTCDAFGGCQAGATFNIDDGNPCSDDRCDASGGITHPPAADGTACNDGNACTIGDTCQAGVCGQGPGTTCAAGNSVVFYESYTNGAVADISGGPPTTPNGTTVVPAPGLFGQGQDSTTTNNLVWWDTSGTSVNLTRPGSVSFWFKSANGHSPIGIAFLDSYSRTNFFVTERDSGIAAEIHFADAPTLQQLPGPYPFVNDGQWHLVVMNWSPTSVAVSFDGARPVAYAADWIKPGHAFGPLHGNNIYAGGTPNPGVADELIILNRPMTDTEIQWYWNQRGAGGPTAVNPAVAHFNANTTVCNQWDDLNPCTTEACTPAGGPTHGAVAPGTTCGDGNDCNGAETCAAGGACVAGGPPAVDDGNVCTADSCSFAGGIAHTPITDGSLCANGTPTVVPRFDGIVDIGGGKRIAVFGYDNVAMTAVTIPPAPGQNAATLNGTPIASPSPALPTAFPPLTSKPGAWLPEMSSTDSISWTLAGQTVTANGGIQPLPHVPIGASGYGVMVGATRVTIKPDLAAPGDPTVVAADPPPGAAFNGTIPASLTVSPTGAAIYTVPIAVPPGVGGMAPALSLVYNSQNGPGVAGQGWDLAGATSIIARCPKTRPQDGYSRAVMMDVIDQPDDHQRDALCLDGQRLYETSPGIFEPERKDFSKIKKATAADGGVYFVLTAKSGETRYFGSTEKSRVTAGEEGPDGYTSAGNQVAAWLLDRAMDEWGNYYVVHYNSEQPSTAFATSGVLVTSIDYTGHAAPPATGTFYSIVFNYAAQSQSYRRVRFRDSTFPRGLVLASITTPAGTYRLTYAQDTLPSDALMLPTRLQTIQYCTGALCACPGPTCQLPLTFTWDAGGYDWQAAGDAPGTGYALPAPLDNDFNNVTPGTQFVDLDGDGRLDFVRSIAGAAPAAWQNTGTGWVAAPTWNLPGNLFNADGKAAGALADLDGDGLLDFVSNSTSTGPQGNPSGIWFNRIHQTGQWSAATTFGARQRDLAKDTLTDVDGDGLADLVYAIGGDFGVTGGNVLLNTGADWKIPSRGFCNNYDSTGQQIGTTAGTSEYLAPFALLTGAYANYHLEDINRDGLIDYVSNQTRAVNGKQVFDVQLNTGNPSTGTSYGVNGYDPDHPDDPPPFFGCTTVWRATTFQADPGATDPPDQRFSGDVDGDGLFDAISYGATYTASCGFLEDCGPYYSGVAAKMAFSTGAGYSSSVAPYLAVLTSTHPSVTDFRVAFADLNADGMIDLVRAQGSQLWSNAGGSWVPVSGVTSVPVVPIGRRPDMGPHNGAAFVDLDGDGVLDLVQARHYSYYTEPDADGNQQLIDGVTSHAWLNKFRRPIIQHFSNGLASATDVTYATITTSSAQTQQPTQTMPTYSETAERQANATYVAVPLRVVESVLTDDGRNTGAKTPAYYAYVSLRGSRVGRGPQGFSKVFAIDALANVTETDYMTAYPYTGRPRIVSRTDKNGGAIAFTQTVYCDNVMPDGSTPASCTGSAGYGNDTVLTDPSRFIYPIRTTTTTYLRTSATSEPTAREQIATETRFRYDNQGNAVDTVVDVRRFDLLAPNPGTPREEYQTESVNQYGAAGSLTQLRGKVTLATVTSQRLLPAPDPSNSPNTKHVTSFDYDTTNYFTASDGQHYALILFRKKVEPGAGTPNELHTWYGYDTFGNVTTTTACATNFGACNAPGAINPIPTDIPFRTATVSYTATDFAAPAVGVTLPLPYGPGRYPTVTTNELGHTSYAAFDPVLGVPLQKTDPNGLSQCFAYDSFGRVTTEKARCGPSAITTTTTRYLRPSGDTFAGATGQNVVVTATSSQTGAASWIYTDVLGRAVGTRRRSFNGGFVLAETNYDRLGRIASETKPYLEGATIYRSHPEYADLLGRITKVTTELGDIEGLGLRTASEVVTTTYGGSSVTTAVVTAAGATRQRTETKNALGKVASVTDANGQSISFDYDADGNVTDTHDPAGNKVHVHYDVRGRRDSVTDPDLGFWQYAYDGFGDLTGQIDARGWPTTLTYDKGGRLIGKDSPLTGKSEWVYDAPGGIGKLAAMVGPVDTRLRGACSIPYVSLTDGPRPGRWFAYTSFGQVDTESSCIDGDTFEIANGYDGFGRPSTVTYPVAAGSRLSVRYHYTNRGYLNYVADADSGSVYWAATARNAADQVTVEQTGNAVETTSDYNPSTGWLMKTSSVAHADADRQIQQWKLGFDEVGNVLTRARTGGLSPVTSSEVFAYDALDRLHTSDVTTSAGYHASDTFEYDALGNLTVKGGKSYSYTGCFAGPHALCAVVGGDSFAYDPNGNMTTSADRSVTYDLANKPTRIGSASKGTNVDFIYGPDGNRVVQSMTTGASGPWERTVYVGLGETGRSLYERVTTQDKVEHNHFIYGDGVRGGAVAIRKITATGPSEGSGTTSYLHTDHLGSVTAVSDDFGHVAGQDAGGADAEVLGYDAWGAKRNADATSASADAFVLPGHRGFTGHETVPSVGLINMNGRVYDPALGRFLSPDPHVQFVGDLQSYNRYSYVLNNPLRYTDPTGYSTDNGVSKLVNVYLTVVAIAVCSGTGQYAAACGVGFAVAIAAYNTAAMHYSSGVPWETAGTINLFGVVMGQFVGQLGGAVGQAALGQTAEGVIVGGATSGAISGAISTAVGGGSLGKNVLMGSFQGALSAAASAGMAAARSDTGADGLSPTGQRLNAFLRAGRFQLTPPEESPSSSAYFADDGTLPPNAYLPPHAVEADIDAVDWTSGAPMQGNRGQLGWGLGMISAGTALMATGGLGLALSDGAAAYLTTELVAGIGTRTATLAAGAGGLQIIDVKRWTPQLNMEIIRSWVLQGYRFQVVSPINTSTLWDPVEQRMTVFARELLQLAGYGYRLAGTVLLPPSQCVLCPPM